MGILKVKEISRIICDTDMGTLKLRLRKGENIYKFVLDAVEVPKDLNNELMEIIYPVLPVVNQYPSPLRPLVVANVDMVSKFGTPIGTAIVNVPIGPKKSKGRGRPLGSKNK